MNRKTRLKKYAELFRKNIAKFLAPGISVQTVVHPVDGQGAVFEFFLNRDNNGEERIKPPRRTVGAVLSEIPQRMISENLDAVQFGGTSLYLEENRIVVIKGEDAPSSWSGQAVINDVQRVVSTSMGSKTS